MRSIHWPVAFYFLVALLAVLLVRCSVGGLHPVLEGEDTLTTRSGFIKIRNYSIQGELTETITINGTVRAKRKWSSNGILLSECYTWSVDTIMQLDSISGDVEVKEALSKHCLEYGSDGSLIKEIVTVKGVESP